MISAISSEMRALLLIITVCGALGCSTGTGYTIDESVTVPPEVQRAFSASGPGFVMNGRWILGLLCTPKSESVVFNVERFYRYSSCEENRDNQDELSGTAYAFRPTESELQRLDASSRSALACGETAPVEDKDVRTDVYLLNFDDSLWPDRRIAVGSSNGECVSSSRYVVNITLTLK